MYKLCSLLLTPLIVASGSRSRGGETSPIATVAAGAQLVEEIHDDGYFFEGPSWDSQSGKLYFTAFPKGQSKDTQIWRLEARGEKTIWARKTEGTNGTYLGRDGRLIGAQAYGHRVLSYRLGGATAADIKTLYANPKLHQPNDVCQTPNGQIYFTDPDWNAKTTSAVYRLDPHGTAHKVISDMPLPNGIKASNDGRTLYVGDDVHKHWRSYPIQEDGSLGDGRVFFDPKSNHKDVPDGFTLDEHGNLYLSGLGGIWIVSPAGKQLGMLPIPEFCSNAAFGGPSGKTLYLTCDTKLYSLQMNVRGGQIGPTSSK